MFDEEIVVDQVLGPLKQLEMDIYAAFAFSPLKWETIKS